MKRAAIFVTLILSATALFARGATEGNTAPVGPPADATPQLVRTAPEEIDLTGTYDVQDGWPVLVTEEGTYSLSAPRGPRYAYDLEPGMELEITGWVVDNPAHDDEVDVAGHVVVSTATVDDQTYVFDMGRPFDDLPRNDGPLGRMGPAWDDEEEDTDAYPRGTMMPGPRGGGRAPRGRW